MLQGSTAFRHARLMHAAHTAGVTVEDLARALATLDGEAADFEAGRLRGDVAANTGAFVECVVHAETMLELAIDFATERRRWLRGA